MARHWPVAALNLGMALAFVLLAYGTDDHWIRIAGHTVGTLAFPWAIVGIVSLIKWMFNKRPVDPWLATLVIAVVMGLALFGRMAGGT